MPAPSITRNRVFISYSHRDRDHLERLQVHLRPLEREGRVDPWDDTRISPGTDWRGEIEQALASARVAVLLVSADFLASDFIAEVELPRLLRAAQEGGAAILPVILGPCGYKRSVLAGFQAVNDPQRPLIGLDAAGQETVWAKVADNVETALADRPGSILADGSGSGRTGPWLVQVGDPASPGWLPQEERLRHLRRGQNPYVAGTPLPANSPVFFGRGAQHRQILGKLTAAQPGSVSLLGERRSGKSSLLSQLVQALSAKPRVLTLFSSAQSWSESEQEAFFAHLCLAIGTGLGLDRGAPGRDYATLRSLVLEQAHQGWSFVLVIDEFEELAGNPRFDAGFFSNLRALGERPEYRLAYLLASRRPLEVLCKEHDLGSSTFWNIFGVPWVLGLLPAAAARGLMELPTRHTLTRPIDPPVTRVQELAGNHPALIQMLMTEWWQATEDGEPPDWLRLKRGLRDYYKMLWQYRSSKERDCLLSAAQVPKRMRSTADDARLDELRLRGLIGEDRRPFATHFGHFVTEKAAAVSEGPSPAASKSPVSEVLEAMATENTGGSPHRSNPDSRNPTQLALELLHQAIAAVPAVKYALGVAGIAAAASLVRLLVGDLRKALLTGLGMFFFMGLLFVFARLGRTIPKPARLAFIWFLIGLFMLVSSLLVSSVFFQWPLPLEAWAMGS